METKAAARHANAPIKSPKVPDSDGEIKREAVRVGMLG